MARVVKKFTRGAVKKGKYPWDQWMNGQIWRLTQGVDFHCGPEAFRTNAYQRAARSQTVCRASVVGNTVEVQFTPKK